MTECTRCGTSLHSTDFSNACSVCGAFIGSTPGPTLETTDRHTTAQTDDGFNVLAVLKAVLFTPSSFFRTLSESSPLFNAWLFALAAGTLGFTGSLLVPGLERFIPAYAQATGTTHQGIGQSPLMAPFYTFLGIMGIAVYTQAMMRITGNRRNRFKVTLMALCYTEATSLLLWIPIFGAPIGVAWTLFLWITAVSEVHRTSRIKALIILMIPLFILAVLLSIIIMSAAMGGLFAGQMLKDSLFPGR